MALTGVLLADFSAFRKEADGSTDALKKMESGADTAASKLSGLGSGFNLNKTITDPLGAATDQVTSFAKSLLSVDSAAALTGASVVALGTAMFALATNAAKVGTEFDNMQAKTGMSVETLSRYKTAAEVVGANMDQLTNVVFKLQQGIGENTDKFQKGLEAMGLSTEELKAAGPDRYLELVTQGLASISDPAERAAAGTAVLGRGYRDVAGALGDLNVGLQRTADIHPWTDQQVAEAKAFSMQLAEVKTRMEETAIALGQKLIPAASLTVSVLARTGEALVHIADLGGLVSGAYEKITGAMGETELAAQTAAAVHESVTRIWNEQGMTVEGLAQRLLEMGYNQKTVAEQTGMTAEQVRKLAGEMQAAKDAAESWEAVTDRVNKALESGPPNIDAVDQATRDWVVSMKEANVSLKDMQAVSGLTAGQIGLVTKAADDAKRAIKEWKEATDRANEAAIPWQQTLDSIDGTVVEAVKYGLSLGASLKDLQKEFGLTDAQAQSIKTDLEEYASALNTTADMEVTARKRTKEIIEQTTKATNDLVIAQLKAKQAEEEFLKTNLQAAKDADAADLARQTAGTERTKTELQKRTDAAKAALDRAYADASVSQEQINALSVTWQEAYAASSAEVRQTGTETADALGGAFKKNFGDAAAAFNQFQGVVAAGSGQIIEQANSTFNSATNAGAYVEMQRKLREAQLARGVFFVDTGFAPPPTQTRDSGGPVVAGTSYMIGGGKAPELFVPGASGFVTPGAGVGGAVTNNFYITQPLGTPDAIARAVADAQVANAKAQGVRLPYQ